MKKSTIKLIAMLLTVVLMLPNFAGAGALNENEVDDGLITEEEMLAMVAEETPALEAYMDMMNMWLTPDGMEYPDTYGGCYIDESKHLIVKLVNDDTVLKNMITSVVSDMSPVRFESASISLNALENIYKSDIQLASTDSKTYSKYIDQEESVVVVEVNSTTDMPMVCSDDGISPHIKIVPIDKQASSGAPELMADILPMGANINYENSVAQVPASFLPGGTFSGSKNGTVFTGSRASFGWYGEFDFGDGYVPCLLIAGHVAKQYELNGYNLCAPTNGTYNGSDISRYTLVVTNEMLSSSDSCYNSLQPLPGGYGGSGDFAIVKYIDNSVTPSTLARKTNSTYFDITKATTLPLSQGQTLYKCMGETGYKYATVLTAEGSYLDEESLPEDYISAGELARVGLANDKTQFSQPGDSGCTVFYMTSTVKWLCGMSVANKIGGTDSYVTPLHAIRNLGFVPYLGE